MKICPVGAELFHAGELFHADGRTDVTKLIVAFRNFTKASKRPVTCPYLMQDLVSLLQCSNSLTL